MTVFESVRRPFLIRKEPLLHPRAGGAGPVQRAGPAELNGCAALG